jgi:hypothetical protein
MIDIKTFTKKQKIGLIVLVVTSILAALLNSSYMPPVFYLPLRLAVVPTTIGGLIGGALMEADKHFWFQASLAGVLANLCGLFAIHFYLMFRSESVYSIELALVLTVGMLPGLLAYKLLKKTQS